jgi:hypothetical protein
VASLSLLTVWEIWKERNARIFSNKHSPTFVIIDNIKSEAGLLSRVQRVWVISCRESRLL